MKLLKKIRAWLPFLSSTVTTPTILQMETAECGAAALGIVLAYYKKYVPLEELRTLCGVSRDGSNALQVIKGAQKLGLDAEGLSLEIEDLFSLELPFIIFWNFNHFVVVEGFKRNKVLINDPASGHRQVSKEEFSQSFTGVVISLKKTDLFQKGNPPPSVLSNLRKFFQKVTSEIFGICLITFCLMIPNLALPAFSEFFFDQLTSNPLSFSWFFPSLLFVFFVSFGISYLQNYILIVLNAKLSILLTSRFFNHLLRLPIRFFTQRFEGEIANRIQITDNVAESLTLKLALSLVNLTFVILYLFVMIKIHLLIALLVLFSGFVNLLCLYFISRARKDAYAENQQDFGKSVGIGFGAIKQIETLKSFGMENDFFEKWLGYFTQSMLSLQRVNIKDIFLTTIPPLMQMISIAFFLYMGAQEVMAGTMTIGMMMALQVLIINFLLPFSRR